MKKFIKNKWRSIAVVLLVINLVAAFSMPLAAEVVLVRPPWALENPPTEDESGKAPTSEWAFDHQTATNAPTGFPNRTDSVLSFVAGTRTFSIAPSNGSFVYYITGVQYTVSSSDDIIIADTYGVHFIYYDGDTLSEAVNPSDATVEDIIENKAWVATIYWNATDDAAYLLGDERHGTVLSGKTHHWLHDINGAAYDSGFTLSGYTEDTDSDAGLTFELTDGKFYDEDVEHSISDGNPANQYEQQLNGGDAAIPIVYKDDIDGSWTQDAATTLPYKSLGAGRLAYNKDDGDGTFSQVEVGDGKWVSMTLIATNDWQYPIKAIQGQNEYTDKKTAVEEATNEIISFGGGALSPEVITLYRFVLRTKDTFGGTKKTKIEVDGVTDFRRSTVIGGAAVAISHGALGGLANDDHAQYLLTDGSRELTDDMAVTAAKTIDGRDLSVDGTKLDGIEALADVTDAANVATAGALMVADLENPPTEDEASKAPTSEWAFDHDAATTGVHGVGAETILHTGDVGTMAAETATDYLAIADLENPPTEDDATTAPTSEWAFDNDAPGTSLFRASRAGNQNNNPTTKYFGIDINNAAIDPASGFQGGTVFDQEQADGAGCTLTNIRDTSVNFQTITGHTNGLRYRPVSWSSDAGGTANIGSGFVTAVTDTTNLAIYKTSGANFANSYYYTINEAWYTVPVSGYYSIAYGVNYLSTNLVADKLYAGVVFKNGAVITQSGSHASYIGSVWAGGTDIIEMTQNDIVTLGGYHTAGINTLIIYGHTVNTYLSLTLLKKT